MKNENENKNSSSSSENTGKAQSPPKSRQCPGLTEAMNCMQSNYKAIFDSSIDVIVIATMDGTIIDINPAVQKIYGYIPGELIGKPQNTLISEEHIDKFNKFQDKIKSGEKKKAWIAWTEKRRKNFPLRKQRHSTDFHVGSSHAYCL